MRAYYRPFPKTVNKALSALLNRPTPENRLQAACFMGGLLPIPRPESSFLGHCGDQKWHIDPSSNTALYLVNMGKIIAEYKGVRYEFDTPQQAAETMALLQSGGTPREAGNQGWTSRTFKHFLESFGPGENNQVLILALLLKKSPMSGTELRAELNIPGDHALGGILGSIAKHAGVFDVPMSEVILIKNHRRAGLRFSMYTPAKSFAEAAASIGWPDSYLPNSLKKEEI